MGSNQNEINPADQPSSIEGISSKKRKIATPQSQSSAGANAYSMGSANHSKIDGAMLSTEKKVTSNADSAREMAVARAGTQFAGAHRPGMTKKQRRAQKGKSLQPGNATDSPSLSTGASSTTGADADDDFSPVASPQLGASSTAATSKSGDISDMLETPSAGPSILRLTDPTNPIPQARAKQANKAFEPAETKKQRQQRLKREAHRAQVAEAEKERRRLLKKQIRGARIAEGTSTQTRTSAYKPPAENAWFSSPNHPTTDTIKAPPSGSLPLLDTFDPQVGQATSVTREGHAAPLASVTDWTSLTEGDGNKVGTGPGAVDEGRGSELHASAKIDRDRAGAQLTEEEQVRLVQDSEESWTTVSKRDKKKASKLLASKETDTSEASGAEHRQTNGLAQKSSTSSRPGVSSSSNSYHQLGDSGFQDSDWAA